ncbi:RNA-directed DNA polymerase, eukaryota, reverse transcriptase zinc-binding domain protein [Tanacetum coccineum]
MGSFRSKEDDVSKILTSIFVTNFPDSFSAKDLFHSCKQYGHVVNFVDSNKEDKKMDVGLNAKDITLSLMAETKRLLSLVNLKMALCRFGLGGIGRYSVRFKFGGSYFKRIAAKWGELFDVIRWTPEFSEEEEEDELSVEDNNDGRINDLKANNGIDESDVEEEKISELARKVTVRKIIVVYRPGFTPEEVLNEGINVNLDMKDYTRIMREMTFVCNLTMAVWIAELIKSPGLNVFHLAFTVILWHLIEEGIFVEERKIIDGPFILDEVLQWCRRKKKHALIFKVDFEKAFDSVRWDFVDDVLNKFGFGERWRTWIQSCLRSSRGSILVNGSPTEEFQFFRGVSKLIPWSNLVSFAFHEEMMQSSLPMCKMGEIVKESKLEEVVEQGVSRLSRWKMKLISSGGHRLTILKSVRSSMPGSEEQQRLLVKLEQGPNLGLKLVLAGCSGESSMLDIDSSRVRVLQGRVLHVAVLRTRLKLGNWDENTRFWVVNGMKVVVSLKSMFPRMFALEFWIRMLTGSSKLNAVKFSYSFEEKREVELKRCNLNSFG